MRRAVSKPGHPKISRRRPLNSKDLPFFTFWGSAIFFNLENLQDSRINDPQIFHFEDLQLFAWTQHPERTIARCVHEDMFSKNYKSWGLGRKRLAHKEEKGFHVLSPEMHEQGQIHLQTEQKLAFGWGLRTFAQFERTLHLIPIIAQYGRGMYLHSKKELYTCTVRKSFWP